MPRWDSQRAALARHYQRAGNAPLGFPAHSAGQAFNPKTRYACFRLVILENAWQSPAYSPLSAVVSPPSEYL